MSRGTSSLASAADRAARLLNENPFSTTTDAPLPDVVGVEPIGLRRLLDHLWREIGLADALAPQGAEAAAAVFSVGFHLAVAPLRPQVLSARDADGAARVLGNAAVRRRMREEVARRRPGAPTYRGSVAMADAHGHLWGSAAHHCRLRRPRWPGAVLGLDPDLRLTMTAQGAPMAFDTDRAEPSSTEIVLCGGTRSGDGVGLIGEHLRDVDDGVNLVRSVSRWRAGPDGEIAVHRLPSRPGAAARSFLVRHAQEAAEERACREDLVARLRDAPAGGAPEVEQRLSGSAARRWVSIRAGVPHLRTGEIGRDAELDGCYLVQADSRTAEVNPAAAYLRFQDLARDAVRRAALVPSVLHPAIGPAMVLVHEAEQRTARPWSETVDRLADVHRVTFADGSSVTTRLDPDQRLLLHACGVRVP